MMEVPVPKKEEKKAEKEDEAIKKPEKIKPKKEGLGVKICKYIFGSANDDLLYGPIPFLWRLYKY